MKLLREEAEELTRLENKHAKIQWKDVKGMVSRGKGGKEGKKENQEKSENLKPVFRFSDF